MLHASSLSILFLGAAAQLTPPARATCGSTLPNWAVVTKMPYPGVGAVGRRAVNIVSLNEHGELFWNGDSIAEGQLGVFLGMIKKMDANSTFTALAVDPRADCQFATRLRSLINESLNCDQASCGEVIPTKVRPVPSQAQAKHLGRS